MKDKVVVRESISKMKNGDLWQHQNKYEAGTGMIKDIKKPGHRGIQAKWLLSTILNFNKQFNSVKQFNRSNSEDR